jgi:deoxyribose-phosphate aldolase
MVVNIGWVKDGLFERVLKEINAVKAVVFDKVLKVIIETCLLTKEEIVSLTRIINQSNADYIKTSTGFSFGGATKENILLIKQNLDSGKKIKASGGIKSLSDAEEFIKIGCDRIGASSIVAAAKNAQQD